MFAKQVKDYCKDKHNANTSQCKRNMMVYGMEKLNEMEESHLDKMDPYQRDANAIRKYDGEKSTRRCHCDIKKRENRITWSDVMGNNQKSFFKFKKFNGPF